MVEATLMTFWHLLATGEWQLRAVYDEMSLIEQDGVRRDAWPEHFWVCLRHAIDDLFAGFSERTSGEWPHGPAMSCPRCADDSVRDPFRHHFVQAMVPVQLRQTNPGWALTRVLDEATTIDCDYGHVLDVPWWSELLQHALEQRWPDKTSMHDRDTLRLDAAHRFAEWNVR